MNARSPSAIGAAWDEYRAWAKRSRTLQASVQRLNSYALWSAGAAAVLGAAATGIAQAADWAKAEGEAGLQSRLAGGSQTLAVLAAAAAAAAPILGRHILEAGDEARWIRCRAIAEAIKSECFRFAARAGNYAGPEAAQLFVDRRNVLAEPATRAGLTPLNDDLGEQPDARRPPFPMGREWYLQNRLEEQRRWYLRSQAANEEQINWLRRAALIAALAGAAIGAVAGSLRFSALAPWIGVATTLGAMVIAHGAMERRQFLAASYGAMAGALARIKERYEAGGMDLAALVDSTETLLQSEHAAWVDRISRTIAKPPPPPPENRQSPPPSGTTTPEPTSSPASGA